MDPYVSPFRSFEHSEPGDDCPSDTLCMSMSHGVPLDAGTSWDAEPLGPEALCWGQATSAAQLLIAAGLSQPAFFFMRQCVELGLKGFGGHVERGHDLSKLFRSARPAIPDRALPWSRSLVEDLVAIDPKGDQGRYGLTWKSDVSLGSVCCASRERMTDNLALWVAIVEENVSWPAPSDPDPQFGVRR